MKCSNANASQGMERSFLGYDLKAHTATIWDGGDVRFCTINVEAIAQALVTIFTVADVREAVRNQHIFISSYTTSQNEILSELEKLTDDKWKVKDVSTKDIYPATSERLSKGDMTATLNFIVGLAIGEGSYADFTAQAEKWNKIVLPNNKETLEGTLQRLLKQ
jgi:hypothetical protein